jgi:NAD+ synthase
MEHSQSLLELDPSREIARIVSTMRYQLRDVLRRRGVVLGLSGGVDSAVVAALATEAFGPERVLALLMPEGESDANSQPLAENLARDLGIEFIVEDISEALKAMGCYKRRDDAIRSVAPFYDSECKSKLVINRAPHGRFHFFSIVIQDAQGQLSRVALTHKAYMEIVAASNFKQRVRKMMEYHHADRLHYAVCGTPNKLEYDQGFFVKQGDGAADLKPIAHLYKSQVYQLAEALGVPTDIRSRPPTTDTYSLPQSQEEFFFSVPYQTLDACLYGYNAGISPEALSENIELNPNQIKDIYAEIQAKRRATRYLHVEPLMV